MNKEYVCCFTGHRDIDRSHAERLGELTDSAIEEMIVRGVTVFRNGGAVGFDTLAALKVIEKKKKYPHLRLELYLPCKNQSEKWNSFSKDIYAHILACADKVVYTSETYSPYCMLHRDKCMVEGAHFCIAYCVRSSGGTAFTMDHAKKHGVEIVNLADRL